MANSWDYNPRQYSKEYTRKELEELHAKAEAGDHEARKQHGYGRGRRSDRLVHARWKGLDKVRTELDDAFDQYDKQRARKGVPREGNHPLTKADHKLAAKPADVVWHEGHNVYMGPKAAVRALDDPDRGATVRIGRHPQEDRMKPELKAKTNKEIAAWRASGGKPGPESERLARRVQHQTGIGNSSEVRENMRQGNFTSKVDGKVQTVHDHDRELIERYESHQRERTPSGKPVPTAPVQQVSKEAKIPTGKVAAGAGLAAGVGAAFYYRRKNHKLERVHKGRRAHSTLAPKPTYKGL
jgi:hypothetical protein